MEGELEASSEIPVMKVLEKADSNADSNKITTENLNPITIKGKKEGETDLEDEFIKVEKEPLDGKYDPHYAEKKSSVIERSSINSTVSRELLESQEKVKELELELERLSGSLKHSESQKDQLNDEVSVTKTKLEETGKKYEELELSHNKLQDQIVESGERYNIQYKTLQEALEAQDAKHKELLDAKKSFESLNLELESSRKKTEELEQDLQSSASEARKFEELHKESGSHAESETKKALEFEKMLKMEKLSAKEVSDQMDSLQEEVKGLYEKIAENHKVEETLKITIAELSAVQGEVEISKSKIEQRLASKEALLTELTQEVDLRKTSESHLKENTSALENLLLSTRENLQVKESELEELKLKLQEEVQSKEAHVSTVQEELSKAMQEKEGLEAAVADLTSNAAQMKELCDNLETKLKSLEELHHESGYAATTAQQKNIELEDIVIASNAACKEAKSQLREVETRFVALEKKNVELEKLTNLLELRSNDGERELREFSEKHFELIAKVEEAEEEKKQLSVKIQEYEDKVTHMESALRNAEEKCTELEGRANTTHLRSRELEDLIQITHSKADNAGKKVSEMELLLEAEKYRIQELEEQISALEKKCGDAEAESEKKLDKMSELEMELEAFQSKVSSLEVTLQTANNKESELIENLRVTTEAKKNLEDGLRNSSEMLSETETLLQLLQNELNLTKMKLESIEGDLKAAGMRESEVMEKLKSAEEQLEHQSKVLDEVTLKKSELETLHESLSRDSELKLQKAFANFTTRDSEAKSLYEKLTILEDKVKVYEEQISKASENFASSEKINEELKTKISEVEEKAAQYSSENELLRVRESEVVEKLKSAEEQLQHQSKVLDEATLKNSELETLHESLSRDSDLKLQEALANFTTRDSEAKSLYGKLTILKDQVKVYEEHIAKATENSASSEKVNEELKTKISEVEEKAAQFSSENELLRMLKSEVMEKLKSAEEQLEHQSKVLDEVTLKNSELETLHESLSRDSEVKLQEAFANFTARDSEAKSLYEKLTIREDQVKVYEEQIAKATENFSSSEKVNEELKTKISEVEEKAALFSSENELLRMQKSEVMEKLKSAEEQLEHQSKVLDEATLKTSELEMLHESLSRDSELKLQEAFANFTTRDSEAKSLCEKLTILENQVKVYEELIAEATENSANSEKVNEELKTKISEVEEKAAQFSSENELLRIRESEVMEMLKSVEGQLEHQSKVLDEAILEKSDLETLHESLSRDSELKLQEAFANFTTRDSEAKSLYEKLMILENQVTVYEEQIAKATENSANSEKINEELKTKISEVVEKAAQFSSENELLSMREIEVMEKLKSAEEQIEHQSKVLHEAILKKSELETLHESLSRDSELKLQEAFANFSTRDSEAKSLYEKLTILENQEKVYEEQIAKTTEKFASSEKINEELKAKISEFEEKAARFSSENEFLVAKNTQLKTKVNELQESLNFAHGEKAATAEQLVSHLNTITELADKHSKASELHIVAEAQISAVERELQESILKFSRRDLEATDLTEKLNQLKVQINIYEQQAHEASDVIEKQKIELEHILLKSKGLEAIIEEMENKSGQFEKDRGELVASNSKLTHELATYESKLNELKAKFSATLTEKDEALERLSSSKKLIEDLTEHLQSQRQADSQKDSEREAALKRSFEEVETKNEVVGVLEKQVKELEQKLQLAETKSKQKDDGGSSTEMKDGMDVKSRDIGSVIATPSKRRSKKKLEAATSPQAPSTEVRLHTHQTTEAAVSPFTTYKFVVGMAVVSLIIGVILGKRY